jgi:V/A-type H+-transporting ATPase subunit C
LQALSVNFLSPSSLQDLLKAKDVFEMAKILQGTWYGEEIEKAASMYQPPELLEVALNRHLVKINKIALVASPFSG